MFEMVKTKSVNRDSFVYAGLQAINESGFQRVFENGV